MDRSFSFQCYHWWFPCTTTAYSNHVQFWIRWWFFDWLVLKIRRSILSWQQWQKQSTTSFSPKWSSGGRMLEIDLLLVASTMTAVQTRWWWPALANEWSVWIFMLQGIQTNSSCVCQLSRKQVNYYQIKQYHKEQGGILLNALKIENDLPLIEDALNGPL